MISEALANINLVPDDKIHVIVPDFSRALVAKCLEFIYTGGVTVKNKPEMEKVFQFMMKHLLINLTYNENVIITLAVTSGLKRILALEFDHVKIKKQKQENSILPSSETYPLNQQQVPRFNVNQLKSSAVKSSSSTTLVVDLTEDYNFPETDQQELDNPCIAHLPESRLSSNDLETVLPDQLESEQVFDLTEADDVNVEVLGRLCDQMLGVNVHPIMDEPTTSTADQEQFVQHIRNIDTPDSNMIQRSRLMQHPTLASSSNVEYNVANMIEEERMDEERLAKISIFQNPETAKSAINAPDEKGSSSRTTITRNIVAHNQLTNVTNPDEIRMTLKTGEKSLKTQFKKETFKLKNLKVNLINRMGARQRRFSKSVFSSNRNLRSSSAEVAILREISRRKKIKTEVQQPGLDVQRSHNSERSAATSPKSNFDDFSLYEDLTQCLLRHYCGTEDENSVKRFKQLRKSDKRIDDLAFGILEVLEGLDILKFASDEKKYLWSGIDKNKIMSTLADIIYDQNKIEAIGSWKDFCNVMTSSMIPSRKGIQIFPELTGKGLMMTLAVLKAVDMVTITTDPVGGILWTGEEDLFMVWDRNQIKKYSNVAKLPLKQGRITLQRYHATEEQIEAALERAKKFETLRSNETKKLNCSCGGTRFNPSLKDRRSKDKRKQVRIGQKRRVRCQKCPACLTPPCRKCKFCKNRSFKKPCQERVCLYPLLPKCPCFK